VADDGNTPGKRACPQCGDFFETANPRRRFCSDRCRVAAFQQRRQRAEVVIVEE
jgi:predicted nucleic acid-binding Zn ribbon protein